MSYLSQILIIVVLSVLGCCKVSLQGGMSRRFVHGPQDSIWFNGLLFAAIALCLAVVFPFGTPDLVTVLYAAAAGICMVAFQSCYAIGLATGPVSITVLIVNFSVLLVTAFGIVFLGDRLFLSQLLGVAALVVSMFLSVETKGEQKKANRRWLVLVLVALLGDAGYCCIQRLFQTTATAQQPNMDVSFLILMYLCASALAFAVHFFNARRAGKSGMGFQKLVLLYAGGIATILSLYQKGTMYAIARIEGTFYYPTHIGLMSLFMTLVGILFFRDRLTIKQKWGVAFGILCVVLMNIQAGPVL